MSHMNESCHINEYSSHVNVTLVMFRGMEFVTYIKVRDIDIEFVIL